MFKKDVRTIKEVADGRNVSVRAMQYAIENGLVDWVKVGYERLIVMTNKTVRYLEKPRRSVNGMQQKI